MIQILHLQPRRPATMSGLDLMGNTLTIQSQSKSTLKDKYAPRSQEKKPAIDLLFLYKYAMNIRVAIKKEV